MSSTIRQDQANVSLTVDGERIPFVFNRREGGETVAEESKTYPGGGRPQQAHGGPTTVENVTLAAEFIPAQDHEVLRNLRNRVGKGRAVVTEQLLDADGVAFGRPDTWTGVLQSVTTGNYDASSADPREVEIEISTDAVA